MGLDERLLAGHGFAVFSRSTSFSAGVVARCLELDPEVRNVVLIHHASTAAALVDGIREAALRSGVAVRMIAWAEYGEPSNVRAVAELPEEGLVFVSLDHHLTVRDRLDRRRSYIRRRTARRKVAVDTVLYEAQPWRVYFPFGFFDTGLLGYHHSYAIEQDHERFLDGQLEENPCAPERIAAKTWRHAVVDPDVAFGRRPTVRVLAASNTHQSEYVSMRDRLFDTEKSIAAVKRKLSDWIQKRYPQRAIPLDLKQVYAGVDEIVRTDLPFDRWLADEVFGLMDHTDDLVRHYIQHQREAGG